MSSVFSFIDCTSAQSFNRESTVELIHLDVSRTFPSLGIFQKVQLACQFFFRFFILFF